MRLIRDLQSLLILAALLAGTSLAAAPRAEYVPPPQPVSSDLLVGSYYFPGHFSPARWMPFKRCGYPTPLLGFYRDGEPEVMDWHLKWALEHGIGFLAFDWYYDWRRGVSGGHNVALDQGFLRARYRDQMKFTLMWCNEGRGDRGYQEEDMLRMARFLAEHYCNQPNFLRVEGDNVFIVSMPERVIEAFGPEGTARVFEKMSEVLRAAGCGGLYPVSKGHANQEKLKRAGFRATTAYNHPTAGMTPEQMAARRAPYASMVEGIEPIWKEASAPGNLPYIVPVSPGWDSRPWYYGDALVRTDPTPALFARMCRNARRYADPKLRMVISECWNEFGEGSYIEPTRQAGFGSLDAIRQVFCPKAGPHKDLTPADIGRTVPTFPEEDVPALSAEERMAEGTNMLYAGDMEGRWWWVLFTGGPARRSATAHAGKQALALPAGAGAKTEWLMPVPPSRKVTLRLWARVPEGASLQVFPALFRNNNWTGRYLEATSVPATGGEWRKLETTLEVADREATHLDVELRANEGECLVDDVEVIPVPAPAAPADRPKVTGKSAAERLAAGENLLYNGDLESEWGWVLFDGKPAERAPGGHGGRFALRVPDGQGCKTLWNMPIPRSKRLRIELWAKVPAGARLDRPSALFIQDTFLDRYVHHPPIASTNGEWKRVAIDATVEDPIAREFNLEFVAHGGDCWIDDVTVYGR